MNRVCYRENGITLQDSKHKKLYFLFNLFVPACFSTRGVLKHAGKKGRVDCV